MLYVFDAKSLPAEVALQECHEEHPEHLTRVAQGDEIACVVELLYRLTPAQLDAVTYRHIPVIQIAARVRADDARRGATSAAARPAPWRRGAMTTRSPMTRLRFTRVRRTKGKARGPGAKRGTAAVAQSGRAPTGRAGQCSTPAPDRRRTRVQIAPAVFLSQRVVLADPPYHGVRNEKAETPRATLLARGAYEASVMYATGAETASTRDSRRDGALSG